MGSIYDNISVKKSDPTNDWMEGCEVDPINSKVLVVDDFLGSEMITFSP